MTTFKMLNEKEIGYSVVPSPYNIFPEGTRFHIVNVRGRGGIPWYNVQNIQAIDESSMPSTTNLYIKEEELEDRRKWLEENEFTIFSVSQVRTQDIHKYYLQYDFNDNAELMLELYKDSSLDAVVLPMTCETVKLRSENSDEVIRDECFFLPRVFDAYYDFENCRLDSEEDNYTQQNPFIMLGRMYDMPKLSVIDKKRPIKFKGVLYSSEFHNIYLKRNNPIINTIPTRDETIITHIIKPSRWNIFPEGTLYHHVKIKVLGNIDIPWYHNTKINKWKTRDILFERRLDLYVTVDELENNKEWIQRNAIGGKIYVSPLRVQGPHRYELEHKISVPPSVGKEEVIIPIRYKVVKLKSEYSEELIEGGSVPFPTQFSRCFDFENCEVLFEWGTYEKKEYTQDEPLRLSMDDVYPTPVLIPIDETKPIGFKGM